jgi:sigma-B regulation protein RsbU (phosphoserine phosphatase)
MAGSRQAEDAEMIKLPKPSDVRTGVMRFLRPRTKWGRTTLWSGVLCVFFVTLHLIRGVALRSLLSGWAMFFFLVFAFCAFWRSSRWVWRVLMWRLRHRLLVAYIFMGVIPIMLLLVLFGVGAYLFAGQFVSYVTISNLQSQALHLEAANDVLASQLNTLDRSGKLDKHAAGELATASGGDFPERTVTVWQGKEGYVLPAAGSPIKASPAKVPDAIKGDFSGLIVDGAGMFLRAVKHYNNNNGRQFTVISSVPVTPEVLRSASARLGRVILIPPSGEENIEVSPSGTTDLDSGKRVVSGTAPPATNRYDQPIGFYTIFSAVDWKTGQSEEGAIGVVTRPSMLYDTLFSSMGDKARILEFVVLAIVILLGLVELVALFIGIRLTRSMTRAVAELYEATQHVDRGDLTHRIQIRGRDQLAVLEKSFNSMTESLVKLVAEQKQKQRMESELAFAYEVQDLLFPHTLMGLTSLDVYGVCRPARSLSGDYYDFIPLGSDKLVLAVGDISGKGIPAALLMATVHAFVRAYSLAPEMELTSATLETGALTKIDRRIYSPGDGVVPPRLSPAILMANLNYQVFRCTPPEKYATMFLACYDAKLSELTYCNAGHLPPIMLSADGRVTRLETSGTVAGLFDGATYSESTIPMQPGDLLVACSDGVTEPENNTVEFGEERLIALIQENRDQPLSRIGKIVTDAVAEWIGSAEQPDDMTVVLARAR